MKFINLISVLTLITHWNACLQYLVPSFTDFPTSSWVAIHHLQVSNNVNTIPYFVIPYHTIPYHTILYLHTYTTPYYTIPYTTPYNTIPCHTICSRIIIYHTIPYYTIPCHTITCLQLCVWHVNSSNKG
jgi:hypothetical protein